MTADTKERVQKALAERLFSGDPRLQHWPDRPRYTRRPQDVLMPGIDLEVVRRDLDKGDGGELKPRKRKSGEELPPKFHAAYSSAALAVNTFAPFRLSPHNLQLSGTAGFTSLEFERQLDTGTGGPPANLDVCLGSEELTLGVESKLIELLSPKKADFSPKYDRIVEDVADRHWRAVYEELRNKPKRYRRLDAAQLVKHYLGIRQAPGIGRSELVYVFWEPLNATAFAEYREHAAEAERMARQVRKSRIPLRILRYSELWQELAELDPDHVDHLRGRYEVAV